MERVRWGILSTARIVESVAPAIQRAESCEVVAIGSRDPDRAAAAADRLGIPTSLPGYEAVLESDDIDAVYIPLPNDLHAEWTIRAAAAGKHVLCEKPLALTAAQAAEMAEACAEAGVKLSEAFMYRHHPKWREAVRLVREGAIGELVAIQSWFSFYNDDPNDIRNRPEHGGGAVMDIGCYCINASRWLFDSEPESVDATVRRDPEMHIDTLTSAVLTFPGGGQSAFTCSIRAEDDQRAHIVGTSGRIDMGIAFNMPPERDSRIFVTSGGEPPADPATDTRVFPAADSYEIQAEQFARAVLDDTEGPLPLSDSVANMAVIEEILSR